MYYNDRVLYRKLTDAQEMGVIADIDSESGTESDDASWVIIQHPEDEEDMRDKDNFDDLTPEQVAREISSDDEEQGLLDDDEKKKKKKWYQRVGSAAAGAASGVVGFFTGRKSFFTRAHFFIKKNTYTRIF